MAAYRRASRQDSRLWPIAYAVQSLRSNGLHNAGIAIILALGVSLIPAVMNWTSTGIRIETNAFVDDTVYQVGMKPIDYEAEGGYDELLQAEEVFSSHPWVKSIDRMMSTICIVDGHMQNTDSYPLNQDLYYVQGYKDARIILANESTLQRWKPLFDYSGEFRISSNEIIVGSFFVDYLELATGRRIQIGDSINLDIVLGAHGRFPTMEGNRRHTMMNLTVVGIFDLAAGTSVFGNAFISMTRKLVDPFAFPEPVLGVFDSVIVSTETIPPEVIEEVSTRSFFSVSSLIQADADELLTTGESLIPEKLMSLMDIIGEPRGLDVWGIQEVENLRSHIQTYQQSRIIILLAFPSLFIAIIIMINASESAVLRRKGEASLLRVKGASYNQILTSYIWESIILFAISVSLSLLLSIFFSVLMGASEGVLQYNQADLILFWDNLVPNYLGIIMAVIIALALPITYLLQIGRFIEVEELVLHSENLQESIQMKENVGKLGVLLIAILGGITLMPYIISPFGLGGILQILLITILLYIMAQYGARFARQVLSSISESLVFLLGEKSLYMTRSLRKRKGRLIPLLVILTIILSTSNMMYVQMEGFNHHLQLEIDYAIGADLRLESTNASIYLNETLRHYPGILETMPVIELDAQVGDHSFYLEAIDPEKYLRIGHFHTDSFISNSTEAVLGVLANTPRGIILSETYSTLWNKTVGDNLTVSYFRPQVSQIALKIVGLVRSAPGFGLASTQDRSSGSVSTGFGFQIGRGGFALVNFDFIQAATGITNTELILASVLSTQDMTALVSSLESNYDLDAYSPETSAPREISREVDLFLSGFESLTAISVLLLGVMGMFSILTLLSAAVNSRAKEYAILRAVGARRQQITSLIFQEFAGAVLTAMLISLVVGITLGITLTTLSLGISPLWVSSIYLPYVPLLQLSILVLIELVLLLGACFIPTRRALDTDPTALLRNL
ncbi:MAG: FtsX-like permease family protein [Candidatus Thorarchaeota archaeon]